MATLANIKGASDASGKIDAPANIVNARDGSTTNLSVGGFILQDRLNGELNDYSISIGESAVGTPLTVVVENGNIIINGDFNTTRPKFTNTELETKLNNALKANGLELLT